MKRDFVEYLPAIGFTIILIFCTIGALTLYFTGDIGLILKMIFWFVVGAIGLAVLAGVIMLLLSFWSTEDEIPSFWRILLALLFVAGSSLLMQQLGMHVGYRLVVWFTDVVNGWLEPLVLRLPDVTKDQAGCGIAGIVAAVSVGLLLLMCVTSVTQWIPTLIIQSIVTLVFSFYTQILFLLCLLPLGWVMLKVVAAVLGGFEELLEDHSLTYSQAVRGSLSVFSIINHLGD